LGLIWIGWPANQSRLDLGLNLFFFLFQIIFRFIVTSWTPITNSKEFVVAILRALGDGIGNNDSDNYNNENKGGSGSILAAARH
jgi:hypothetical protein